MLPIIIDYNERLDLFLDGFNAGYNEQLTEDSIDIHIQLAKLAAKACCWFIYMPLAFLSAYCIIGTECYEWNIELVGEEDVFFPIVAPILYVTQFAGNEPDYRTLQQWCKQVFLPATGKHNELKERWDRFCKYGEMSGIWNLTT